MISLIEALNYRCLRYVRQELGPFHLLVGPRRPVTTIAVADHLLIEVDDGDELAGFWLTGVPPFPSEE